METRGVGKTGNSPVKGPSETSIRDSSKKKTIDHSPKLEQGPWQVDISSESTNLAKARDTAKHIANRETGVRQERVEALRNQIHAGQYTPSAENIADGMLREAIRDQLSKDASLELEDFDRG